ncbi:FAD binding domain-containing protein [Prosthecomicrobium pneumaticum]|uniref:Carbon-monoxide dehydrogenase medium subunit n=1 Tax=Prosthecomicrobium pneumaticum TaxID=81895 RepID=A0A7W9L252_9HYPH|nr:xanthine dehydrogenase family protein subunit M [Prosthecomicrobium pneumaticum]MBB5753201.1 carbon-monoxide dehydrogenase medium subunit [Prosthecomicrobium pneumaticum]
MYETTYHRPSTLAEAASLFSGASEARFLAGGQTLLPTMKQRLAAPTDLIDLSRLAELKGIEVTADAVTIGAGTTHATVATSAEVARAIPALAKLAGLVGDPAVRHLGTLGGSLANNDPAADYPAAVLGLGATVHTTKRSIAAEEYFQGLFTTALEEGEIITRVSFPIPARADYQKFRHPASRYALTAVFAAQMKDGSIRVAVTGAGSDGVFRAEAIEAALAANPTPSALDGVSIDPAGMLADIHGSAAYRANLVTVMAKRAVGGWAG